MDIFDRNTRTWKKTMPATPSNRQIHEALSDPDMKNFEVSVRSDGQVTIKGANLTAQQKTALEGIL